MRKRSENQIRNPWAHP